jgi:hypothetical protein
MVEQAPLFIREGYPDRDPVDEITADHNVEPYRLRQLARADAFSEESVPLFLSDHGGEPDPSEYANPLRKKRGTAISSRILAGVVAAAAIAVLYALFSSDGTRDMVLNAKASVAAILPASAQSDPSQLTRRDTKLKEPSPATAAEDRANRSVTTAGVAPTREEIKSAYQNALQSSAPRPSPVMEPIAPATTTATATATATTTTPTVPTDSINQLGANEIAALLRRGDSLIASGDIAAARLVMRRAADAGDARAAMTLAETYDPAILEKMGVHGVVPDLALARGWYEKAKRFGAAEATQRLELLASKQR